MQGVGSIVNWQCEALPIEDESAARDPVCNATNYCSKIW